MMGIMGLQSYRSTLNPRSDLNREVELGAHGLVYLLLQVPTAGLSDSVWHCSAQLLKKPVAAWTSCFVQAGFPPPWRIYCSGSGWQSLQFLWVKVQGGAIHRYPTPHPPRPHHPVAYKLHAASVSIKHNNNQIIRSTFPTVLSWSWWAGVLSTTLVWETTAYTPVLRPHNIFRTSRVLFHLGFCSTVKPRWKSTLKSWKKAEPVQSTGPPPHPPPHPHPTLPTGFLSVFKSLS